MRNEVGRDPEKGWLSHDQIFKYILKILSEPSTSRSTMDALQRSRLSIQTISGLYNLYNNISIYSGGSSVSQNKLPQLILGYIYILKYLQGNFIG